jgi:16S rRNA (guanine527-N7)-methyltransferase
VWHEVASAPPTNLLDLGSGGGLPGLVLLEKWASPTTFVDSMVKRTAFLEEVLGWEGGPSGGVVVTGRAEELARNAQFDGRFSLVTARSFGPPAVTAECAARFLEVDGYLIVSEPPNDDDVDRWNPAVLGRLGLRSEGRCRKGAAYQIIRKVRPTPDQYPRGIGTPGKTPLS